MEIKKFADGTNLTIALIGRLDAVTALELDRDLSHSLADITDLTIDLAEMEYVSSAGLRILLKIQKRMDRQGTMRLRNLRDNVREVFDMTGFADFLTIEGDRKEKFSVSF